VPERLVLSSGLLVLQPHGLNMADRWAGLGYDNRIMTGWASMGQAREQAEDIIISLIETEGVARADGPAL
jgi:hypothetical protein